MQKKYLNLIFLSKIDYKLFKIECTAFIYGFSTKKMFFLYFNKFCTLGPLIDKSCKSFGKNIFFMHSLIFCQFLMIIIMMYKAFCETFCFEIKKIRLEIQFIFNTNLISNSTLQKIETLNFILIIRLSEI